jgi:hypothetical protein
MAIQNRNLYFQLLLLSLIIYLSKESELSQINERRDLQTIIPSTSTRTSTRTTSPGNSTGNATIIPPNIRKSSSGGLSTGAIVGIVIPCIGGLLAAGIIAALCRAVPTTPPIQHGIPMDVNYLDASIDKFNTAPVQQVVIPQQPVAVVQQPVVTQPVAVVQQPVAVVQEPVALVQQPVAAVVQEPVAMVQQPVAVVQEQVAMAQQPVAVVQQPVTTVQQFGPV